MQDSEVKEREETTINLPNRVTFHRNRTESNPYAKVGRRMPLPLHYRKIELRAPKCHIQIVKAVKKLPNFF